MDDKILREINTSIYKNITDIICGYFSWNSDCGKNRKQKHMQDCCQYCLISCKTWNITPRCEINR